MMLVNYFLIIVIIHPWNTIVCPLGYERVYLPLREVADTPFHVQGEELITICLSLLQVKDDSQKFVFVSAMLF